MSRDRPASDIDGIEITPEMIEAGIMQYVSADDILETQEEIVTRIYRAMANARMGAPASLIQRERQGHK